MKGYTRFIKARDFLLQEQNPTWHLKGYSRSVDKTKGSRCDQSIRVTGYYSKKHYPELIGRIKYYDEETDRTYVFLSNNFKYEALTVTQLYKERWKIVLFSNG